MLVPNFVLCLDSRSLLRAQVQVVTTTAVITRRWMRCGLASGAAW